MLLSLDQERRDKYENSLNFNMDYDSGYISHNPESNLDSSSCSDILTEQSSNKPVYLSEDALLEKPDVRPRLFDLSMEIDREDYEETRNLFNSSDIDDEAFILPKSEDSHEISYSGFDKDSDISDIEIPCAAKIVYGSVSTLNNKNNSGDKFEDEVEKEANILYCEAENDFKGFSSSQKQHVSAFYNITNTLATDDPKKKLTLIFSKCDKENVYTVKRKYRSLTPNNSLTEDELEAQPEVPCSVEKVNDRVCLDHKDSVSDMSIDESCDVEESVMPSKYSRSDRKNSFSETLSRNFVFDSVGKQAAENTTFKLDTFKLPIKVHEPLQETHEIEPTERESCGDSEVVIPRTEIGEIQNSTDKQRGTIFPVIKIEEIGTENKELQSDRNADIGTTSQFNKIEEIEIENDILQSGSNEDVGTTVTFIKIEEIQTGSNEDIGCISPGIITEEIQIKNDVIQNSSGKDIAITAANCKIEEMPNSSDKDSGNASSIKIEEIDIKNVELHSSSNKAIGTIPPNPEIVETRSILNEDHEQRTSWVKLEEMQNITNEDCKNSSSKANMEETQNECGGGSSNKDSSNTSPTVTVKETKKELTGSLKKDSQNFVSKAPQTPKREYKSILNGSISPDLFEDEETLSEIVPVPLLPPAVKEEKYIHKKDRTVLRRARNHLKGVLPPHSVTVIHTSVSEMLNKIELNKDYFWDGSLQEQKSNVSMESGNSQSMDNSGRSDDSGLGGESKSLLVTCALEDCTSRSFPKILEDRCHGLYHNRSKLSEEFEDLCAKYAQRYVGAETQSTCTVFESNCLSPMKRKQVKQRWAVKSPGRRLSHLARRRITFSSVNLQSGISSFAGSRARQILVDTKKLDNFSKRKSPKKTPKKTPSKSPRMKTRTPSSSAKKKLAMRFRKLTGEIEKTNNFGDSDLSSRRALFASPDCDKKSSLFMPSTSGLLKDMKKPSSKRALFASPTKRPSPMKCSPFKRSPFLRSSPLKRSPFKRLDAYGDKKRKRTDSEDTRPCKQARSQSIEIRPSTSEHKAVMDRTQSDSIIYQNKNPVGELSAVHKKKLQWAVYEALRTQNVTPAHAQFKLFASILARLTRRFLPNLSANAPRPEGGTSERMLRIARHHVFAVVKGKSVDEIYNEYVKSRARQAKPQGYVSLEEFVEQKENKENACRGVRSSSRRGGGECPPLANENKIERIRKVINFGDDNR
nr:uncharacterized protein LOC111513979 [Leptinotarsa decemlineata]